MRKTSFSFLSFSFDIIHFHIVDGLFVVFFGNPIHCMFFLKTVIFLFIFLEFSRQEYGLYVEIPIEMENVKVGRRGSDSDSGTKLADKEQKYWNFLDSENSI